MPIYEYKCWKCNRLFELEHGMNEAPLAKCPQCGEPDWIVRVISKSSFVLKGRRWGKDGYSG